MEGPHKQPDNTSIVWVMATTLIGGAVVLASFIALQALYLSDADELELEREAEGKRAAYQALVQRQTLDQYRKTDDGRIEIPIERAVDLVIRDVQNMGSNNLVPTVGPHNVPTVPPVFGKPPANVQMPPPEPEAAPPAEGAATPAQPGPDAPAAPVGGDVTP